MACRDVRLSALLRADPDGVPLDLAKGLVPWRTRLNFGLLSHLHLHANAQRRHAGNEDDGAAAKSARISRSRLVALIGNLRNTVAGLSWKPGGTEWSDYADNTSYNDRATAEKARLVGEFVAPGARARGRGTSAPTPAGTAGSRPTPASGSSPGTSTRRRPSGTTARSGARGGPTSCRSSWTSRTRARGSAGAAASVARCSSGPTRTWSSRSRWSTTSRSRATSRCRCWSTCSRTLAPCAVVEFVPKEDPMVRRLLATRRDVFPDYSLDGFRAAAAERFDIVSETAIADSPRVLFLLRRRGDRRRSDRRRETPPA